MIILNKLSENIKNFIENVTGYLFGNQEHRINYNDMFVINCIKDNKIPKPWIEKLNLELSDNLVDWYTNFVKKFSELKIIETNRQSLSDNQSVKFQLGNVFDSIFNLMLQFSLKEKVNKTLI